MSKNLQIKEISIIIIAWLLIFPNLARSQSNETVVTYDLDKRDFESTLPFDEVFKIKFKSTKIISGLKVNYKIDIDDDFNDPFKKKYYFQVKEIMTKENMNISSQNFSIGGIGPLHPNTPYLFKFFAYEKVTLTETAVSALKEDVKKIINKLYVENEVLPGPKDIDNEFKTVLNRHVLKLYNKDGTEVSVQNIFIKDLGPYKRGLAISKRKIDDAIKNYNNQARLIIVPHFGASFCQHLEEMDLNKLKNAAILDEPINLLIKGHSAITLRQMISFYKLNCERSSIYSGLIINGRAKFIDNFGIQTLEKNQKYQNAESLDLFKSSIILLNNLKLTEDNTSYFEEPIDTTIISRLDEMIISSKIITKNRINITELNAQVPDILADKFSRAELRTDYYATADIESKASPYINLDLGFLFSSKINDVFALQTVNFHAKPVNRNAPLRTLTDRDEFWKRACLQLGLAQKLGPSDDSYHTFLTGDLGTPYIGLGFRLTRILRISAGLIVYQKESDNPIITDKTTKGSFSCTITINSALSSALGYVGGLFKGVDK